MPCDGLYAYVDAADYEWLNRWKWYMCSGGYAGRNEKGKTILMQPPEGMLVHHIDNNKANNCRSNLHLCTRPENQRSARKQRACASQYKGVFYDKRCNKWFAKYRQNGKYHLLGYYDLEVDAARAYDYAAVLHYGEFARPNFPEEWPPQRRAQLLAEHAALEMEGKKVGRSEGKRSRRKRHKKTP